MLVAGPVLCSIPAWPQSVAPTRGRWLFRIRLVAFRGPFHRSLLSAVSPLCFPCLLHVPVNSAEKVGHWGGGMVYH